MSKSFCRISQNKSIDSPKFEIGYISDPYNSGSSTPGLKLKSRKINARRISRFNSIYEQNSKRSTKKGRKSLIGITIMDMKNIEEEIKNKILIMKYYVQIEMRQVYGDTILDQFLNSSTTSNENSSNNSSNYENNANNENINENSFKSIKRYMTSKSDKKENK